MKTPRILLIEDEKFTRELYEILLEEAGFIVDVAPDGLSGLAKGKKGGYDLILLDIMLPRQDGIEVLRSLKSFIPEKTNGKIVMLTVLDNDAVIKEAMALGADGYLMKSALAPDEVLSEVRSFLKK